MGSIIPRQQRDGTTRYRAQIRIKKDGKLIHSESETFSKRAMAQAWLNRREDELEEPNAISASKHKGLTIGAVLEKYRAEMGDAFGRSKGAHLAMLERHPLASEEAVTLTVSRMLEHVRSRRAEGAGPSTVNNDIIWLRVVWRYAKQAWGYPLNPQLFDDVTETAKHARLIAKSKRRDRRPTAEEIEKLDAHFLKRAQRVDFRAPPMRLIMWLAIYSCRRQDELCGMLRKDLKPESGSYTVRDMKHPDGSSGNTKLALMPKIGWAVVDEILRTVPSSDGRLLPFNTKTVSAYFTRACKILEIDDLRFHDLRHEGASRLAEDGATIPEIQQVTLHESWSSLQIYVNIKRSRQRCVDFTTQPSSL